MQKIIDNFIYSRMDEVFRVLSESDPELAVALVKREKLHSEVREIISSDTNLTITAGDCRGLRECLEQDTAVGAILQRAMYRQGYLDCVYLLRSLGAI